MPGEGKVVIMAVIAIPARRLGILRAGFIRQPCWGKKVERELPCLQQSVFQSVKRGICFVEMAVFHQCINRTCSAKVCPAPRPNRLVKPCEPVNFAIILAA